MNQYFIPSCKSILLVVVVSLFTNKGFSQKIDFKELASKVNVAVNNATEASYVFHDTYEKLNEGEDTSHRTDYWKCYYKKIDNDTLIGYKLSSFENIGFYQIYDGKYLYSLFSADSILEITDKTIKPERINQIKLSYFFYPYFKSLNDYIQIWSTDTSSSVRYEIDTVYFKGESYYRISQVRKQLSRISEVKKVDMYLYVSTTTYLPVRFYLHFEKTIGKAKERTTFDNWVTDINTDNVDDSLFVQERIPPNYKQITYTKATDTDTSQLLPVGAVSPNWELPLITGGKVKLSDFRGKIVVLDFWFKSCVPCQRQMLSLRSLEGKYNKDKVVFIGINTTDDPVKDKLKLFINNRNIDMVSAYNGKTIEPLYHIDYSPCLIIIDKDMKIIFNQAGYSNTLKDDIIKTINEHL